MQDQRIGLGSVLRETFTAPRKMALPAHVLEVVRRQDRSSEVLIKILQLLVLRSSNCCTSPPLAPTPMLHDGWHHQTMSHGGPTRVSAVIYALPQAAIVMESPSASRPLPPRFRATIPKAPFFRLDLSFPEWEPGLVQARIDVNRAVIEATAKALDGSSPEEGTATSIE